MKDDFELEKGLLMDWLTFALSMDYASTLTEKQPTTTQLRIATTAFFFISGFGYSSWASRIPSVQQALHLSEAQLGSVLFALPIGLLCTLPITNSLLGKTNSRKIMLFGALAFNLVLSLPGFTTHVWQLVAILFCFGSTRNILNLSMNAQAVGVQQLYDRSIITSFHATWSLAGFAGAGVGYLMVKNDIGTSWHLFAVSLFLFGLTLLFYPNSLDQQPVETKVKKKAFALPEPDMIKFSIICFGSLATENTMYDWSSIYFQKTFLVTKATATAAFMVYMVCMTIGRFSGDFLVTRFGIKKLLGVSGLLIFFGLMVAIVVPNYIVAGGGFALVGFGVSCIVPLVFSLAGKSTTMSSGQAIASISTIGYLGFLMVPPVIGYVAQAAGLRWSFAIIATMGAVIVWMVSKIKEA